MLFVVAGLATDDEFVGKASLAIQGYAVADVSEDNLDEFGACLTAANNEYPAPIYGNQDKYCTCYVEGFEGCEMYISKRGVCGNGFLPDTKYCGSEESTNDKDRILQHWQFSNCKYHPYRIQYCDDGCDFEKIQCNEDVCTETDRGYDIFTYSEITGENSFGTTLKEKDNCVAANKVKEFYCKDHVVESKIEECEYGCTSGKCNKISCTDSDGGKDKIYIKGTIRGGMGGAVSLTGDWCEDSNTLREHFCGESGTIGYTKVQCEAGCLNGKCVYSIE